jgi:hypothetical protein
VGDDPFGLGFDAQVLADPFAGLFGGLAGQIEGIGEDPVQARFAGTGFGGNSRAVRHVFKHRSARGRTRRTVHQVRSGLHHTIAPNGPECRTPASGF